MGILKLFLGEFLSFILGLAYLGFTNTGGNSFAWMMPCTVNITSSMSTTPARLTMRQDAGSTNCSILFVFQKFMPSCMVVCETESCLVMFSLLCLDRLSVCVRLALSPPLRFVRPCFLIPFSSEVLGYLFRLVTYVLPQLCMSFPCLSWLGMRMCEVSLI